MVEHAPNGLRRTNVSFFSQKNGSRSKETVFLNNNRTEIAASYKYKHNAK